ncbi:MAG TPA: autotransporter outer membrane beta-barrel domain-containing protein [Methylomirabilota bacterium]|nr:autotransporter outer membrane beta-barrel domain-containing protein [Methylomirabilota bacterium]
MKLRWMACSLVLLGSLAMTAPVGAQGLNDVLSQLLGNGCLGLGNRSFGPQLTTICQASPGGGASTAGGTAGGEVRAGGEEQRQIFRRLRQRQAAASADAGGARGFGVYGSADYQKFEKDTTRFETGFERDTVGATVGADYLFRNGLALGAAVTYAHEFGDYDQVGGGFDHDAYGILVYGSVVPFAGMFVDAVAGYTRRDYSFDRRASIALPAAGIAISGSTTGDTDGNEFRVGVNTGYDFLFGRFTVGPRAGVLYRETTIDGYRESGRTGLELAYDNQNIQSLTTTVGVYGSVALSTGFGVIVPQATAEYVHEFLDDQRSVGFSLVQDPARARFLFQTDPPDRDYFNVGVGVAMVLPSGLQPYLNFRELLGYNDRTSHTVTLGLRVPF